VGLLALVFEDGGMKDTELYRQLLGLQSPWSVARVAVDLKAQRVDVWAEHSEGQHWPCPSCGQELALYDHTEERSWRHLDTMQFATYLHARVPRVKCPKDGVHQVSTPWAEPRSRFTMLFERLAIDVLLEMSVRGASRVLRISWDEAEHLMHRAVSRGLKAKERRPLRYIGVDEKAVTRGRRFFTLVCDLERGVIEHIADERKIESLDSFFSARSREELSSLEAVALDMWPPYIASLRKNLPDADSKMVFDKFHIMRLVTTAVDTVRKRENREHRATGSTLLTGTKYLWVTGKERLNDRQRQRFSELKAVNLKTGRAWALKESLREMWSYRSPSWALKFWRSWYGWAMRSGLEPMKREARMIAAHLPGVLTYFKHRITNAVAEGLNSKIQTVLKRAYGFRNLENFKTAIYFHCGGLRLHPATHTYP